MNLLARSLDTKRKQQAILIAIVCCFLLALPSCRIPCLRDPEWGPELPETFNGRSSTENSADVAIPEFFNDPVLTGMIDQALGGNQELKILGEEIQIANNEILARKGAYFPFFNIGPKAGIEKLSKFTLPGAGVRDDPYESGKFLPNPLPNFLVGTEVSWQVDIWRKLRNARDSAARRYLGTIEGRNYIVTRLVAEIAENYYGLMALDKRLENVNSIIQLQEKSLEMAQRRKEGARGTELPVQRFLAEVRRNYSEKLIINQEIIETENKINFILGRFPMPVERVSAGFLELTMPTLNLGVPSQLLQNRPDIREAERELEAAELDVKVARARFYPTLMITGEIGYEAFNPRYLVVTPESVAGNVAGSLIAPVINRAAIKADYFNSNAKQLQAVINYQRVTLNAFTEVINRVSKVENYGKSIEIKKLQLESLEASVDAANKLFQNARIEYLDVLFAQRDLRDARQVLIDTKREQLSAVVNTYQALGGGSGGLAPIFNYENAVILPDASVPDAYVPNAGAAGPAVSEPVPEPIIAP